MRVAFNARLLSHPSLRGWNRYTINLLACLPAQGVRPVLYSIEPIHPDHLVRLPDGSYDIVTGGPRRTLAWEQWWLPRRCRADGVDVLHSTFNFGLPVFVRVPRVLTLHDAIDYVYYRARAGWRTKLSRSAVMSDWMHRSSRWVADHIITVSEHAKGDLVCHFGLPSDRVTVTPEAADPNFAPPNPGAVAAIRERLGLVRPYLFYIGGWEGRKNLPLLIRAFAAAGLESIDLVLAGGRDCERAAVLRLARELRVTDRLRMLGWVADADLPALYAGALCFVYPSEYEGFGLQLVEAMAVGCPVLAARSTSLPEVLGSGGETFGLADPAELTALIKRVTAEPEFRSSLADRARQRAAEFSWDRTAAQTVAVYRRVARSMSRSTASSGALRQK